MAWEATAEIGRFDEALDWFRARTVLTRAEALRLDVDARQRAFWIGGGLQLSQVQLVFDEITKAIETGEAFEDWRKRVRFALRNDAHAETVFRNATQRSLSAGRWRQMNDPDVLRWRPYFMHDSVLDSRTTETCRTLDGVIRPADDPHWQTHWPPGHHRCRRGVRSLRKQEAERRGVTNVIPPVDDSEGFGLAPDRQPVWKPDPSKFDPALVAALERKAGKGAKASPKPKKPPKKHDPATWEAKYEPKYGAAAPALGWGRAMQERALDRSAADVLTELKRLHKAGHPAIFSSHIAEFEAIEGVEGNRPLRKLVLTLDQQFAATLSEHTRTIKATGAQAIPFAGDKLTHPAVERARRFYGLTADQSVRQPHGWQLRFADGVRAYASPSGRFISFNSHTTTVVVHEWAHAIETVDSRALARSLAFVKARTKGESLKHLGPGYGPSELTRPDDFIEKYIGKDYGNYATEATSVGYEFLAGHPQLEHLLRKDPDMVMFLLGQLAGR